MDGHAGRDPDTDPPELTAAVLADLQAGLLDDATAARTPRTPAEPTFRAPSTGGRRRIHKR